MSFPDTPLQGSVDSIGWGIAQQNGRARRAERVHPIVQHERLPLRGVAHLSADDAGRQEAAHAAMRSPVPSADELA